MPFGLKNAPFEFQKVISNIMSGINFIKIFLDDILVYSQSKEEHYDHLKIIFSRLKSYNCSINFKKVHSLNPRLIFGDIDLIKIDFIDSSTIEKLKEKINPQTKKQLMSLIGLFQWFTPFIANLSVILSQITDILKKGNNFIWTNQHKKITLELFELLKNNICLYYLDTSKPYDIYTDACDVGCDAVIIQDIKLIAYSAKILQKLSVNIRLS
ncbi:Retrovirus-related Pol polyprotein from transposon 17.6 [Dictyocoela muelleri]|nr:Retrovirus-related Pol polyprotein from transposon 17.6 [Dictyocoela muelleri]